MKRRGLINNKRGEALPLNVIIIAIIVIVVLVVVLLIFIGGIAGLQDKFKSKADDSVLAARECENYCTNIQDELNPQVVQRSAFCNKVYRLDVAPLDGKIENELIPPLTLHFSMYRSAAIASGALPASFSFSLSFAVSTINTTLSNK